MQWDHLLGPDFIAHIGLEKGDLSNKTHDTYTKTSHAVARLREDGSTRPICSETCTTTTTSTGSTTSTTSNTSTTSTTSTTSSTTIPGQSATQRVRLSVAAGRYVEASGALRQGGSDRELDVRTRDQKGRNELRERKGYYELGPKWIAKVHVLVGLNPPNYNFLNMTLTLRLYTQMDREGRLYPLIITP